MDWVNTHGHHCVLVSDQSLLWLLLALLSAQILVSISTPMSYYWINNNHPSPNQNIIGLVAKTMNFSKYLTTLPSSFFWSRLFMLGQTGVNHLNCHHPCDEPHEKSLIFFLIYSIRYYTCSGLFLYLFDKLLRFLRGSLTEVQLISAEHHNGVTRYEGGSGGWWWGWTRAWSSVISLIDWLILMLRLVFRPSKPLKYTAGQYMFLHIPVISNFQWHPFSISSAPSSQLLTFHIKDMGSGTFTNHLAQLAERIQQSSNEQQISIQDIDEMDELGKFSVAEQLPVYLDGPYGRCSYVEGKVRIWLGCIIAQ